MTTVEDMIKALSEYPKDAEVIAYDPETCVVGPITGYLYDPTHNTVEICTDDQNE